LERDRVGAGRWGGRGEAKWNCIWDWVVGVIFVRWRVGGRSSRTGVWDVGDSGIE
jgi:hypothetical protein